MMNPEGGVVNITMGNGWKWMLIVKQITNGEGPNDEKQCYSQTCRMAYFSITTLLIKMIH
jgi:hypothetical protein